MASEGKTRKQKANKFADIAEAEELTPQRQLELARAKAEAKQAMKEAKYAYKMQKMLDRRERCKARDEERAEEQCLLQLCEEQGMVLPNGTTGAAYASRSGTLFGLASHSPGDASIHSSLSNQGLSSTFTSSSTSGGYYHSDSPVLPAESFPFVIQCSNAFFST